MKKYLLPASAVALTGVLIYFGLRGNDTGVFSGTRQDQADIAATLQRLAEGQETLARRIDGLELNGAGANTANNANPGAGFGFGARGRDASAAGRSAPLTPAEVAARREQNMRELENKLISEPISAQWASRNESSIEKFLSVENLAKLRLPSVDLADAKCHSSTCRINMIFEDEVQAQDTSYELLQHIAANLPAAQSFLLPQSDGTVRMMVYATSSSPTRRREGNR